MEVIASLVNCLAAIIIAGAAIYGICAWKREFRGKRQIELAEDVLALFYEAREAITAIRSLYSYEGEGSTREPAENETPEEKKVKDRAYIVWERHKKCKSLFSKLHSIRYRFMAQVGVKEAKPFEQLRKIVSKILLAASTLSELWVEGMLPHQPEKQEELRKEIKKYEAIFWWQGSKDDISKRADEVVADMDKTCKNIIMQK